MGAKFYLQVTSIFFSHSFLLVSLYLFICLFIYSFIYSLKTPLSFYYVASSDELIVEKLIFCNFEGIGRDD